MAAKVNPNDPVRVPAPRIDSATPAGAPAVTPPAGRPAVPPSAPDISRFSSLTRATGRGVGGVLGRASDPVVTVAGVSDKVSGHLGRTLEEMDPPPLAALDELRSRHA